MTGEARTGEARTGEAASNQPGRLVVTVGGLWTVAEGLADLTAYDQALAAAGAREPITTVELSDIDG